MIPNFNNFQKFDSENQKLNEGNFISSDITGIIDTDAKAKLSSLTIDKLLEGLDLEKSDQMHRFIATNAPSLQEVMGLNIADDTFSIEIIKQQLNYIAEKITFVEKDFTKYYNYIISAYKTEADDKVQGAVAGFTSPEGFSSIIPEIEELVQEAKKSGIDFTSPKVLESFNTLHRIKIPNITSEISKVLEESAFTYGIVNLYKKIDAMDLEEIKSDSAISNPDIYIAQYLNLDELYKSEDPVARMGAFFEEVLNLYPYIKQLKRNFNDTYDVVESDLVEASIRQFIPTMDYSAFDQMSILLNKVCGLLVNRVYINSPFEDNKNIFVPALQAIYMGLLAIVSTKLINFNIKVQTTITQKEEEKKQILAKTAEDRVRNVYNSYKLLIEQGFFMSGSGVYKEGGLGMNPEIIKNLHYFLNSLKLLPDTKVDSDVYDRETADAVIKFQTINKAQKVDGKIGSETKAIMDKTANFLANKYNII
jgi:hypothetical protein